MHGGSFGNKFSPIEFNNDLDAIRAYYLDNGYAKFQIIDTNIRLNEDKTEANVIIKVNEGEQYTVKNARIVGDVGGMSEALTPLLKQIYIDDTFRRSDVVSVEESIKSTLGEQGYANAQVNVNSEFDDENKTIALTFVVDAGRRYSVRQIRFEGNTVSADSTLRQEMRQQEARLVIFSISGIR